MKDCECAPKACMVCGGEGTVKLYWSEVCSWATYDEVAGCFSYAYTCGRCAGTGKDRDWKGSRR